MDGAARLERVRGFGSIVVNDMHISYAPDAEVRIDGARATPAALRVGQVVRTVATGAAERLSTRRIEVTSEAVGRIETCDRRTLTVLRQTVSLAGLPKGARRSFHVGETVAVSGLRRPDGVIAASLIEAAPPGLEQIAGPLDVAPNGALAIGALRVAGVDPRLVGRRVMLRGRLAGDVFEAVEAYVERRNDGLVFGLGPPMSGSDAALPLGRPVLAVIEATRGASGWRVDSARIVGPAGRGASGNGRGAEGGGGGGGFGGGNPGGGFGGGPR